MSERRLHLYMSFTRSTYAINRSNCSHSEDIRVEFHLIGGNPFLQIGDDLISVEELKRYRKVYVANSLLLYSTNAVRKDLIRSPQFVSLIQLIVSLFTHSWGVIVPCFLSFVATLCLLYSLRMVSKSYLWFVVRCFVISSTGRRIHHRSGGFDIGGAHDHFVFEFDYFGSQHGCDSLFSVLFYHVGCGWVIT